MKKGDLVKVRKNLPNPRTRFRIVGHGNWEYDFRYIELPLLVGKTGIVTSVEGGGTFVTLHVAFGSTVIRANDDYFTKLKKFE